MEEVFPDLTGSNFNSFREINLYGLFARVMVKAKHGELLTRTMLEKIRDLDTYIQQFTVAGDGGPDTAVSCLLLGLYNTGIHLTQQLLDITYYLSR